MTYGQKWRKEMMTVKKEELISLLRTAYIRLDKLTPQVGKGPLKGEDHPESKLTAKQIELIFIGFHIEGLTHKVMADMYDVHRTLISKILQAKVWRHLTIKLYHKYNKGGKK